jgi:hypothetical protein
VSPEPEPIRIYSSMRGLASAALAPGLLAAATVVGYTRAYRVTPIIAVLGVLALLLAGAALFDLPRQAVFAAGAVTRVCVLRRHVIPWDDILVLRRARGSMFANLRSRNPEHIGVGPLIAKVGRRNYLLCNQSESRQEYDRIREGMAVWAPDLVMGAARPPEKVPPSDLYRRRRAAA